jgi:predicted PurR-regulated permease PerM
MPPVPVPRPPRPRRMPLGDYAAITAIVILVGVLAVFAYTARGALLLVFLGFFLATGLEPAIQSLGRRRVPRGAALALVLLVVLVIVGMLLALLVVPAVNEISALSAGVPQLLSQLSARVGGNGSGLGARLADPAAHDQLSNAIAGLGKAAVVSLGAVFTVLGAITGGLFSAITVLALLVYFSLAMPRIRAAIDRALEREDRVATAQAALARVGGFVSGQLIVSACAGAVSYIYFLLAGVPYPALLAIIVALLDTIPQVGATLASVVGIAVSLTDSVSLAVATLIFFIAYQMLENYLLAPRVFAKTIELTPASAFVAVLVGASVGGLLGAVTALPLTAAGKVVLNQALAERSGSSLVPPPGPDPETDAAPAPGADARSTTGAESGS